MKSLSPDSCTCGTDPHKPDCPLYKPPPGETPAEEPDKSSVDCVYCGEPSDRGFIRVCRKCSGL